MFTVQFCCCSKVLPKLIYLFLRFHFFLVKLVFLASLLLFFLIHTICLPFLLIHTSCFLHSCHTLSLSLPFMFSSYLFFLSLFLCSFFSFLHMQDLHAYLCPQPLSPSLLLISVLVSCTCFFDTFDLALVGLSGWYAVHSHTWQDTEVQAEYEL